MSIKEDMETVKELACMIPKYLSSAYDAEIVKKNLRPHLDTIKQYIKLTPDQEKVFTGRLHRKYEIQQLLEI